jgi:predicted RND superfamily exporter protein
MNHINGDIMEKTDYDIDSVTAQILTMKHVGASITLTSICNCLAFASGALGVLPGIQLFATTVAVGVVFNYLAIVFAFSALLILDGHRILSEKATCPSDIPFGVVSGCISFANEERKESEVEQKASLYIAREKADMSKIPAVLGLMTNKIVNTVAILISIAFIAAAAVGIDQLETGLTFSEIVPSGTYQQSFLVTQDQYFSAYSVSVYTGLDRQGNFRDVNFRDPFEVKQLVDTMEEMKTVKSVDDTYSFLTYMIIWANKYYFAAAPATFSPHVTVTLGGTVYKVPKGDNFYLYMNNWFDFFAVCTSCFAPASPMVYCTSNAACPNPLIPGLAESLVNPKQCSTGDTGATGACLTCTGTCNQYAVSPSASQPCSCHSDTEGSTALNFINNIKFKNETTKSELSSIREVFTVVDVPKVPDKTTAIQDTRDIIDRFPIPQFAFGLLFEFYEQYIYLEDSFTATIITASVCVLVASSFLLFSPLVVILMGISIIWIIIVTIGFIPHLGLKFNVYSAINVVLSIAFGVEVNAHVARAFMIATGDNTKRVYQSLNLLISPLCLGTFTTFLGLVPLGFAKFKYFQEYFFGLYSLVLLFSLWSALFLLPALLVFFGPTSVDVHKSEYYDGIEMDQKTNGAPKNGADTLV